MSAPEQIEVRAIDVVPYEHAIWCSVGGGEPFSNTIELRSWSEDGEHIWFMLGTHNFYKAKPDEMVRVVVVAPRGERKELRPVFSIDAPQFDNEGFLAKRPKPRSVCEHCGHAVARCP